MAIAFVAEAHAASGASEVSSLTVNVPTGTSDGYVLVAVIGLRNAGTGYNFCDTPSGWTLLVNASGTLMNQQSFYRVASSEPASYTFSVHEANTNRMAGAILAYSGVNTTTVPDVASAGKYQTGTSNTPSITSVTTVTDGALAVIGMATQDNITADPSGWTQRYEYTGTAGSCRLSVLDKIISSAGSTGGAAWTILSATYWATVTNALRPATVVAGQPITLRHGGVHVPGLAGAQWRPGRSF